MNQGDKARLALTQLVRSATDLSAIFGNNIPNFDRAQQQLYTPFRTLVIDLGRTEGQSALGDVYKEIAGDFIYVDPDTSSLNGTLGTVTVEVNDQTAADVCAFTANPGFALNAVFKGIKVRYTSQPGKRLVLKYSTGYSVVPSFAALTSISNTVNVANVPPTPGVAYASSTLIVAGTPKNVIAAASNTGGFDMVSWGMSAINNTGAFTGSMLAKATAPATKIDGQVIDVCEQTQQQAGCWGRYVSRPGNGMILRRVASGLRLDLWADISDTGICADFVNYTLR